LIESVVAAVLKLKDGSGGLLADALLAAVFLAAGLAVFLAVVVIIYVSV
jgi:hypothetical protein